MTDVIHTVIVEDNRLVRDGLTSLLKTQKDFRIVAAVDTPKECLAFVEEAKPDVVLVDAALGRNGSRHLVSEIRTRAPSTKVIVMDLLPSEQEIIDFAQAGSNGFIMKDATLEEFVTTIRSVANGASVVPPALTSSLLSHIAAQAAGVPGSEKSVRMTRREREIIELIADGLSNKDIATQLGLAPDTVKSHVHNILEKLALHSRLQIAAHAHKTLRPREPRSSK